MRVPSTKETIAYFASLSYLVEKVELEERVWAWKITGPDCPLDGREFYTRLALWSEWLDYSAERIREASLIHDLHNLWGRANEEDRALLAVELHEWQNNSHASPRLSKLIRKAPSRSTDKLPWDWKKRIAKLVEDNQGHKPLSMVVRQLKSGYITAVV